MVVRRHEEKRHSRRYIWTNWRFTEGRLCEHRWWQNNEDVWLFRKLVAEGCLGTSVREKEPFLVEAVSPSLSEIGRAELHETTKTGTTRGAEYLGPDQTENWEIKTAKPSTSRLAHLPGMQ